MQKDKKRLAKVSDIVSEALFEMGEDTESKWARALSFALSFYRQWHSEKARDLKADFFELDDLKRFEVPSDFLDWVTIGIQYGDRIIPAYENKSSIIITPKDDCGKPQSYPSAKDARSLSASGEQIPGAGSYSGIYGPHINSYGENIGGLSGVSGARPQLNFTFLPEEDIIQFNTDLGSNTIYMEYLAYPFNIGGDTLVHYYAIEAMKSYIFYMFDFHNNNSTESRVDRKRRRFKKEYMAAAGRMDPLTPHDIYVLRRMTTTQGPRV